MSEPQTVTVTDARALAQFLKSDLPEAKSGNVEVRRVQFTANTLWPRPGERPPVGAYTELLIDGEPYMSDYPNEVGEMMPCLGAYMRAPRDSSILLLGLGLGVLVRGALLMQHKGPIHVVEKNADVLALVQPRMEEDARMCEAEIHFHLADAYEWEPPPGLRFHITYADIWPSITEDNLPGIERIAAKYRPLSLWMESWSRAEAEALRAHRESGKPPIPGIPIRTR